MDTIVIVETVSAVFLAIFLITQTIERNKSKSSKLLNLCIGLVLFTLIVDAMAYIFMDDSTPFAFRYAVCLLAYLGEGICFLGFAYYSEAFFAEKTEISPVIFRIVRVAELLWMAATAAAFVTGRMVLYKNGVEVADDGYPVYLSVYQIAVMLCIPVTAFLYRKKIGNGAVILLSFFNLAPVAGILTAIYAYYDCSYIVAAAALVFIAELLQRKQVQSQKAAIAMHESLAQNNSRILVLEDDFESLYDVEMKSGHYASYVKGDFYQNNVGDKLVSPTEFFEDLRANVNTVIIEEDRDEVFALLNRETITAELAEKEHIDHFYRVNTEKGPMWLKMRIVYKDAEKKNVIIGIFNAEGDFETKQITEKNRLLEEQQKQLEAALETAQTASKAKTEFLFNMSHDIRTPMNAILGYTNIALNHVNEPDKVNDSLKKIRTSGGHLLSLINDILEMSRIEAGRLEIINVPLNILEAAEGITNMSKALAATKDIDFRTETGELNNPYVYADELHINQIVINLISNAIKYTEPGGTVIYRIEQISKAKNGTASYRFTVSDNGIGMSSEFQEHLFESFSRENSAEVSKQEGAGLGLAIVKRIVEHTGGTIRVQSRRGKGSTFVVELPFEVMNEEAVKEFEASHGKTPETVKASELEGKRVLLVEDNEMNREIAAEILTESGLVIETAEDGAEAVKTAAEKGPDYYDFILMDIQMPVMDGYEATREIRTMYPNSSLPIIALSANAFEEDKIASREAGMNEHVAKPIDIAKLKETMAKFL